MINSLSAKERVNLSLFHKDTDRVPIAFGLGFTPEARNTFEKYLQNKGMSFETFKNKFSDIIGIGPDYIGPESEIFSDGSSKDIWGIIRKPQDYCAGIYDEISFYPLANISDIKDVEKYPWPKAEYYDFENFYEKLTKFNPKDYYMIQSGCGNILETATWMMGMEKIMIELIENPELVMKVFEHITDFFVDFHQRLLNAGRGKVDIIITADDIGSQRGLLISKEMFSKYIKPFHTKLNKTIKEFGAKVMFHSDGGIMEIIPELIDMGIDILEALQFDADGMDPELMKERYGDVLCFHGGVSVQKVLPFGNERDVEEHVKYLIDSLYKNGGYILAPCHSIQVGTPPENVMRMFEVASTYKSNIGG